MSAQLTLVKFNCPSCNAAIQVEDDVADNGVKCPQCGVGFVPENREYIAPPQPPAPPRTRLLEQVADILQACGIICIIIAGIVGFTALASESWLRAYIAAGWLSAGIAILILSQLLFIRLSLERRDR